jgi:hypothetical protein
MLITGKYFICIILFFNKMEFIFYMHNICLKRGGGRGGEGEKMEKKKKAILNANFFFNSKL